MKRNREENAIRTRTDQRRRKEEEEKNGGGRRKEEDTLRDVKLSRMEIYRSSIKVEEGGRIGKERK